MTGSFLSPDRVERLIGVLCILIIVLYALYQHVNGVALAVGLSAIAGILGVRLGQTAQQKIDRPVVKETRNADDK